MTKSEFAEVQMGRREKIRQLKELCGFPTEVLENHIAIANMSYNEYLNDTKKYYDKMEEREKIKTEYHNTHKIDVDVVKKLYERFDNIKGLYHEKFGIIECVDCFNSLFEPLDIIPKEDYYMEIYEPILDSLRDEMFKLNREFYAEKFKNMGPQEIEYATWHNFHRDEKYITFSHRANY